MEIREGMKFRDDNEEITITKYKNDYNGGEWASTTGNWTYNYLLSKFKADIFKITYYPYKEGDYVKALKADSNIIVGNVYKVNGSVIQWSSKSNDGCSKVFYIGTVPYYTSYFRPAFPEEILKGLDVKTELQVENYYWSQSSEGDIYLDKGYNSNLKDGYFTSIANMNISKNSFASYKSEIKDSDMLNIRLATPEERQWLDICINNNKFVKIQENMNETNFKVGDRVSVRGLESIINFTGQEGIIKHIETGGIQPFCIEFDSEFNNALWNPTFCARKRGYKVKKSSLTLINREDMNDLDKMIKEAENYSIIIDSSKESTFTTSSEMKTTINNLKPRSKKICYTSTTIKIAM